MIGWALPDDADLILENEVSSVDDLCNSFPEKKIVEGLLVSRGYILDTDYTGRCGNCHSELSEKDKYCTYCGTKRGDGKFLPFENPMYCVYGPPIKKVYVCNECRAKWRTYLLSGGKDSAYCPQCGHSSVKMIETRKYSFGEEPDDDE